MSKKIFYSIWLVTSLVLLSCLTIVLAVVYSHFTQEQFEQLRDETRLATQGVILDGQEYIENLGQTDFRITWITSEGIILYDSEADQTVMENHLEREEIRQALETGSGQASRYSSTLSTRLLYTAQRLPDGSVLRLSITQLTVWHLFMRFLPQILIILAVALLLSSLLASRLAARIVEPINRLNLERPMEAASTHRYDEIRPLLARLDEQRRQIQKDQQEIEKTSLIRQEFTANASHELKTPLHVISGYAELLETGMVQGDDVKAFAGKIRGESERMANLVEDIIDLSRLDGGAVGMRRERADLYRIAGNAVESLEGPASDAQVEVSLVGSPSYVSGIPHVLYSIVYNLCVNAIKYSEPGDSVTVRVHPEGSRVILRVEDTGIGIPQADLDRIFERFYRVDKSHSKEVGGTGLGLSIVKHAARIHGASITVESEVGKGSAFTLSFPEAGPAEA
ncbi:MAG: PAS domain-containing sensor histidine kinase [Lachnospiraceae bacterium]|nr:PAS domain-containing sensor histidine kinase [Lachnospiraceae bacterium]